MIFYPPVTVIPLQLPAYHSAIVLGFDPDKPRNLVKSVTVKEYDLRNGRQTLISFSLDGRSADEGVNWLHNLILLL